MEVWHDPHVRPHARPCTSSKHGAPLKACAAPVGARAPVAGWHEMPRNAGSADLQVCASAYHSAATCESRRCLRGPSLPSASVCVVNRRPITPAQRRAERACAGLAVPAQVLWKSTDVDVAGLAWLDTGSTMVHRVRKRRIPPRFLNARTALMSSRCGAAADRRRRAGVVESFQ